MVVTFLTIFLVCRSVAKESEKCNTVQFSFYDPEGKSTLTQNFTAQSFERNKQPVYYSLIGPQNQLNQTIIWWNKENDTWLGEIRSYGQERGDFSMLNWTANKIFTKSQGSILGKIHDFSKFVI